MADIRDNITERLFLDAGIREGMRVLDAGCALGEASFMVTRIVGDRGSVLGVDLNPKLLEMARNRSKELGIDNVSFIEGDLGDLPEDLGRFDAVVGRRVLMYLSDPVKVVRKLAGLVDQGGILAFQEHDSAPVEDNRGLFPLHDKAQKWIWETVRREGGNIHMGFDLHGVLSSAGLVVEQVRAEAIIAPPGTDYPLTGIIRAILRRIIEKEVATEQEIDVDTLEARLAEEHEAANTVYIGDTVFSAWAKRIG